MKPGIRFKTNIINVVLIIVVLTIAIGMFLVKMKMLK